MSKADANKSKDVKKKKGIPLPVKLILIFMIILVLSFAGLYGYMKYQTNPDRLLDNYMKTFMSKDTDALFNLLEFEKQEFITPELFKTSMEECHKYSTITNYGMVQAKDSTEDMLHYEIKYLDDNRQNPYTQDLRLIKSETPLYFFFDDWKIDNSEFLAKNCSLSIPADAEVSLDGVSLDKGLFTAAEKNTAVGNIGDLFPGTHELTVSVPQFDDFTTSLYLKKGDYKKKILYSVTDSMMTLSEETLKKLTRDAEQLIHIIYENALKEKPFKRLAKKANFEESSLETLKLAYDTLVANNIKSPTHLTDVNFHKCTSSSSSTYAEDGCYAVNILSDIDYTSTSFILREEIKGDDVRPRTITSTKTGSSHSLFSTTFHCLDGKWTVHDTTALDACVYYPKY